MQYKLVEGNFTTVPIGPRIEAELRQGWHMKGPLRQIRSDWFVQGMSLPEAAETQVLNQTMYDQGFDAGYKSGYKQGYEHGFNKNHQPL